MSEHSTLEKQLTDEAEAFSSSKAMNVIDRRGVPTVESLALRRRRRRQRRLVATAAVLIALTAGYGMRRGEADPQIAKPANSDGLVLPTLAEPVVARISEQPKFEAFATWKTLRPVVLTDESGEFVEYTGWIQSTHREPIDIGQLPKQQQMQLQSVLFENEPQQTFIEL